MSDLGRHLASAAYTLFAVEQTVTLPELAEAAVDGSLPLASTQTPDWFAAAAEQDSDLLDIAPELRVLPTDLDAAEAVDVTGLDLIHVYAPELLAAAAELEEPAATPAPPPAAIPEMPRTSTQLGLLSELSGLDD